MQFIAVYGSELAQKVFTHHRRLIVGGGCDIIISILANQVC
jgi:hypothetical protein